LALSLIEDLAELEALEDAEDLKDAREALAEMNRLEKQPAPANVEFSNTEFASDEAVAGGSSTVPYEKLRRELGLDR
jgi:hypothetical protein